MRLWNLKVLVARRMHLEPVKFKLVAYFHRAAADTADGVVKGPRREIVAATGILKRKIRPLLKGLGEAGELEVRSLAEANTVVRVLAEHWSLPPAPASCAPPAASPAEIKQLMFRLTGKRATLEDVRELMEAAGVDYEGLGKALDYVLRRGDRYEGFQPLAAGVAHQVRVWEKPGEFWESSRLLPAFSVLEQPVGARLDHWLKMKTLSPTEFKLVVYLFVAAAESPDGVAAQSQEAIAAATQLSSPTVINHTHDLEARGVIEVLSEDKESTLIRFPGCRGWFGLPELILKA